MDTLTDRLNAIVKADTEMFQEWAQLIAESVGRLAQAQLDAADRVCSEGSRQYRALLAAPEPGAFLNELPRLFETSVHHASEVTCQYLDAAVELNTGLIRIFQSHLPVLNQRFFESVNEATRVAKSVGALELAPPRLPDAEAQAARETA